MITKALKVVMALLIMFEVCYYSNGMNAKNENVFTEEEACKIYRELPSIFIREIATGSFSESQQKIEAYLDDFPKYKVNIQRAVRECWNMAWSTVVPETEENEHSNDELNTYYKSVRTNFSTDIMSHFFL